MRPLFVFTIRKKLNKTMTQDKTPQANDNPRKDENRATFSALATLFSGILLSFLSFALNKEHIIDDSVLWYFSQCLLYAGGIFSIKEYALREIRRHLRKP